MSKIELDFQKCNGLIPAIAQDHESGEVLMLAYISPESWAETLSSGYATYFSRSRNELWKKGETSGHLQKVKQILVDCDQDTVIFKVEKSHVSKAVGQKRKNKQRICQKYGIRQIKVLEKSEVSGYNIIISF